MEKDKFSVTRYPVKSVTLCLAAIAQKSYQPKLILCFDHQVSDGQSIHHDISKCDLDFGLKFTALFSGTLDHVTDALRIMKARFQKQEPSFDTYKEELWAGFEEFRAHLQRRGVSDPDVDLIISGFIEQQPVLVQVSSYGLYERSCFATNGSGYMAADAMLRWRKPHPFMDLAEMLYYIYEAKRFGEVSPFVGKDCTIFIASHGLTSWKVDQLSPRGYQYLEEQFQRSGPQNFEATEPFPDINFY